MDMGLINRIANQVLEEDKKEYSLNESEVSNKLLNDNNSREENISSISSTTEYWLLSRHIV